MSSEPPPPSPPPRKPLLTPLIKLDTAISKSLHAFFDPFLPTSLLLLLELSADFRFSFPVTIAILLSPLASPSLLPFLSSLLFGFLLDLIFVGLVKITIRRNRPLYNHHSMNAAVSADHFSFPSGHASRVFFVAALVSVASVAFKAAIVELRGKLGFVEAWISDGSEGKVVEMVVLGVYVWAALTASSRVLLGRHFFLDVLAGACLGVFEGFIAFRFLNFENFLSTILYLKDVQFRS